MTEDQIERRVERAMDQYDAEFMTGRMTQSDYDETVRELNRWADNQYRLAAAAILRGMS